MIKALFCILDYLLKSKLLKLGIKIRRYEWKFREFCVILEYLSLGKCPSTKPWERLEKFLSSTSDLKMSRMPCDTYCLKFDFLTWLVFYWNFSAFAFFIDFMQQDKQNINTLSQNLKFVCIQQHDIPQQPAPCTLLV